MLRKQLLSGALVLALCFGCAQAADLRYTWYDQPNMIPPSSFDENAMSHIIFFEIDSDDPSLVNYDRGNYVNQWGEYLLPIETYDFCNDFSEGLAYVEKDGKAGYIDTSGAWVIQLPIGVIGHEFHEGVAHVIHDYPGISEEVRIPNQFIDQTGQTALLCPSVNIRGDFSCGLVEAQSLETGRCGYIDKTGAWVVPPEYTGGNAFYKDRAIVWSEEWKEGVVNAEGDLIIPCIYDRIYVLDNDAGGCVFVVELEDNNGVKFQGLADYDGTMLIEPQTALDLTYSDIVTMGRLVVGYNDLTWEKRGAEYPLCGVIDLSGQELLPPVYMITSGGYQEGLMSVLESGSTAWKYIDTSGQAVLSVPETVSRAWNFVDGVAELEGTDYQVSFIDHAGNVVIGPLPYSCSYFSQGVTWVFPDGRNPDVIFNQHREGVFGLLADPRLEQKISSWAVEELSYAEECGLVTESNNAYFGFRITRRRFAELAANLVEQVTGQEITPLPEGHFRDTDDIWVRKAAALGLVNGIDDGSRFSPNGYISREQLSAVLYRTITYLEEQTGTEVMISAGDLSAYSDGDQVSSWARESVAALCAAGILQGTSDTTLSPKDTTTVEQAILLTLRAYQLFKT